MACGNRAGVLKEAALGSFPGQLLVSQLFGLLDRMVRSSIHR